MVAHVTGKTFLIKKKSVLMLIFLKSFSCQSYLKLNLTPNKNVVLVSVLQDVYSGGE